MAWIINILVFIFITKHQVVSSGIFELKVTYYENEAQKDDMDNCCTGGLGANSQCLEKCRPIFRLCLKEYQVKIDTISPCTFGDNYTFEPKFNPGSGVILNPENTTISVGFPFTWPGTFSMIIETWQTNNSGLPITFLSRLSRQKWLNVTTDWSSDLHTSKNSHVKFQYRVKCDSYYYGKGCETICRPRDDSFGHYACTPKGTRVCLAGWTGDYCTKPQCTPGCNEQHGSCLQPNECRCQAGWEGPLCNQCQRYPGCLHGTCVKQWDCLCNEGWGGLFCNQDLNFCTNHHPCQNGGTCFNTGQGSYTCMCPSGYSGVDCEKPLHDCTKTPCLNGGTCNRNSTINMCICPLGHSGPRCESSIRTCDEQPCRNGGFCSNTEHGYRCECKSGFTGLECEHQINSCKPSPCKNDGTCVESNTGYQCICPSGFTGVRCETNIDDCLGNPCQNGGTCLDKINEFRCKCVPGYVGALCQNRVDYCIAKPCANGGTCLQLVNDYKCKCAPGFTGKDCSQEVNECQFEPCQHGGTCVNRVHGFECLCPSGFLGRQCEEVSSSAAPSARVSSDTNLTTEHVVVIATISTFVPLVVFVAVGVIICLKQRRKREKARADEEARLQNEQNTANSSFAKRGAAMSAEAHMIKNSWGKCTNNVISSNISSPDDCSVSNISVSECDGFPKPMHQIIDGRPVYSLQRTRSQKQLNTEPGPRASALLAAKLHEPEYEHIKRLSVMSNASAVCGSSDPSLLKRPVEKESNGVYVIEEHFHRPDAISAGLFATEV